jgi:hypothetical protein
LNIRVHSSTAHYSQKVVSIVHPFTVVFIQQATVQP